VLGDRDPRNEQRLIELEIRSDEHRNDVARLEEFVRGYEARIVALEGEIKLLRQTLVENGIDDMPAPEDDLPPHY